MSMSRGETPRSEQPENKEDEPIIEPKELREQPQGVEETSEIQKRFRDAMKIENIKEVELEKIRAALMKKYQNLPKEKIDEVIQSGKIPQLLEDIAETRLEWEEKRKKLYFGIIDIKPIKDLFYKIKAKFFGK